MKKSKTLEVKLRSAIRLIWSRSAERRAIIKAATMESHISGEKTFLCSLCSREWPIWAGEVDHDPAIGSLEKWQDVAEFIRKMFFGPQRVVCKACHKRRTAEQRRKKK